MKIQISSSFSKSIYPSVTKLQNYQVFSIHAWISCCCWRFSCAHLLYTIGLQSPQKVQVFILEKLKSRFDRVFSKIFTFYLGKKVKKDDEARKAVPDSKNKPSCLRSVTDIRSPFYVHVHHESPAKHFSCRLKSLPFPCKYITVSWYCFFHIYGNVSI